MLKRPKLIEGHYECRSFDETVPIFTDILGMEVIQRRSDTEWTVKHPNTGWLMVLHAAGPNAKDKPLMNHYGWRVSSREEVDRAQEYLKKVKDEYRLPRVGRPSLLHIAYSFYFGEPGGNSLELEYYEPDAVKHRRSMGRIGRNPMLRTNSPGKVTFAKVCLTAPWNATKAKRSPTGALSQRFWGWNWFHFPRSSRYSM
jgi:hypothetical protein